MVCVLTSATVMSERGKSTRQNQALRFTSYLFASADLDGFYECEEVPITPQLVPDLPVQVSTSDKASVSAASLNRVPGCAIQSAKNFSLVTVWPKEMSARLRISTVARVSGFGLNGVEPALQIHRERKFFGKNIYRFGIGWIGKEEFDTTFESGNARAVTGTTKPPCGAFGSADPLPAIRQISDRPSPSRCNPLTLMRDLSMGVSSTRSRGSKNFVGSFAPESARSFRMGSNFITAL